MFSKGKTTIDNGGAGFAAVPAAAGGLWELAGA